MDSSRVFRSARWFSARSHAAASASGGLAIAAGAGQASGILRTSEIVQVRRRHQTSHHDSEANRESLAAAGGRRGERSGNSIMSRQVITKVGWLRALLLSIAALAVFADTTFGAVRVGFRNNRNSRSNRSNRTLRPSALSGATSAARQAQSALNAARAEQAAAQRNLASASSTAKARHDNSSSRDSGREESQKAEAAHDAAKDEVLAKLRQNNAEYTAAQAKLKDAETRLKTSSDSALKSEARQLRLDVSSIESIAFAKDSAVQAAQNKRDEASARMQALRRDSEKSIAQDSSLNQAKTNAAKAATKVQLASQNYNRTVASANAAANAARAAAVSQAIRPRYVGSGRYGRGSRGWGYRGSSSRFRRYR